ncbi:MAG TPA: DoxX family protein [Steroidobacteraceae bacterium]|jgi:putative oxidoreductase
MPANSTELAWMLGRVLLGAYYAWAGIHHFTALAPISASMTARGVPAARAVLVIGSIFQTACGLALIFGLWPGWAALGLVLFTIVASIMLVDFWNKEGEARAGALGTWRTNLALSGGLLIAAAYSLR